jgi:hypothetical protein
MFGINEKTVRILKELYPKGCRVELIRMEDPYAKIPEGTKGTVTGVDDIGTIHVHWDSGHHLGIAYGEDECRRVAE